MFHQNLGVSFVGGPPPQDGGLPLRVPRLNIKASHPFEFGDSYIEMWRLTSADVVLIF